MTGTSPSSQNQDIINIILHSFWPNPEIFIKVRRGLMDSAVAYRASFACICMFQLGKPTAISPLVKGWLTVGQSACNLQTQHASAWKDPGMICCCSWLLQLRHAGGASELLGYIPSWTLRCCLEQRHQKWLPACSWSPASLASTSVPPGHSQSCLSVITMNATHKHKPYSL